MADDALGAWLRVRGTVPWAELGSAEAPVAGRRDGAEHHVRTVVQARSRARAAGLLAALHRLRQDASTGREGPLPATARRADDPDSAVELVRLLHVLIRQTRRRSAVRRG